MANVAQLLLSAGLGDWLTTFGLVFGGCCCNALTLEVITSQHAKTGTLITFAQYVFVTLTGLRRQLVYSNPTFSRAFRLLKSQLPQLEDPSKPDHALRFVLFSPDSPILAHEFVEELRAYLARRHRNLMCTTALDTGDQHNGVWSPVSPPENSRSMASDSPEGQIDGINRAGEPAKPSSEIQVTHRESNVKEAEVSCLVIHLRRRHAIDSPQVALNSHSSNDSPARALLLKSDTSSRFSRVFNLRLKRKHIPLTRYLLQVIIFLCINLLNNMAFAYHIPMAVHIIFRSGGLVVNMILGRIVNGKRYTRMQIISVLLVTLGICLTTLSATQSKPYPPSPSPASPSTTTRSLHSASQSTYIYLMGILILTLALILSGFLGILQDRIYSQYGRGDWEESMFYLHSLALPMFAFLRSDISAAIKSIHAGPHVELDFGLQSILQHVQRALYSMYGSYGSALSTSNQHDLPPLPPLPPLPFLPISLPIPTLIHIPHFYIPLSLNLITQVICVSGVNKLTVRVSSLTVTLILTVRKAVSLGISIMLLGSGSKENNLSLVVGAIAVLVGTIGYAIGSRSTGTSDGKDEGKNKQE